MNSFLATSKSLKGILNPDNHLFIIPKFQREYTWGKTQWEELFNDLIEHDEGYFLGNILSIGDKQTVLGKNFKTYHVIDGQQRLITLSIFILALYKSYELLKMELNVTNQNFGIRETQVFDSLPQMLIDYDLPEDGNKSVKLRLQKQNNNDEDYYYLIGEQGLINYNNRQRNYGNRRISKAYRFFFDRIQDYLAEKENKVEALKELRKKLENAILIEIEVENFSDANSIFESINNRGIPLTSVDLIKNIVLSKLDSDDETQNDYYYNQWIELLENLGEDYRNQERFLRHYYNAFRRQLNAPFANEKNRFPLGAIATRSTIISNFEPLIKSYPKEILEDLVRSSRIYSSLLYPRSGSLPDSLKSALQELQRVNGVGSYLLLLNLIKQQETLKLSEENLLEILKTLVTFFVRRHLTDIPPTRDIDRLFISIINDIEEEQFKGEQIVTFIKDKLKQLIAPDELFRVKLSGPIYNENKDITRFILCSIAEEGMTRENKVNLWEKTGSQQYVWTIEHIFPQGENIPKDWIDMIADGNKEQAEKLQNEYVHKLGNLTITAYNSTLGNKSFIEKRDRTNKDGKPIGYKNGLNLNADLADKDVWKTQDIEDRTEQITNLVLKKFAIK